MHHYINIMTLLLTWLLSYWHLVKTFASLKSPDVAHGPAPHFSGGLPKKENGCAC